MVMGPTPPGTGVMRRGNLARRPRNPRRPTRRQPRLRVASSTRFVPTSMTTAPGLHHLRRHGVRGSPAATTRISAVAGDGAEVARCRCEQSVTVAFAPSAFCPSSRTPSGLPDERRAADDDDALARRVHARTQRAAACTPCRRRRAPGAARLAAVRAFRGSPGAARPRPSSDRRPRVMVRSSMLSGGSGSC